jgi:hypothetical protein
VADGDVARLDKSVGVELELKLEPFDTGAVGDVDGPASGVVSAIVTSAAILCEIQSTS